MERLNCVLLVDDEEVTNFITTRLVKKLDISRNINYCMNGEEALLYLSKHGTSFDKKFPQLIILDNNMPEMSGIEFMESFNSMNFNKDLVKIIVLTSSTNPKDKIALKSLGVDEYLIKPLTEAKLLQVLEHQHLI